MNQSPVSQKEQILRFLQNGGKITHIEALNLFGCFSLAQRIKNLKDEGHAINSEMVTLKNKKRIALYTLKTA